MEITLNSLEIEITCVLDENIAVEILLVWMGFTVFTGFSVGVVVCVPMGGVVLDGLVLGVGLGGLVLREVVLGVSFEDGKGKLGKVTKN